MNKRQKLVTEQFLDDEEAVIRRLKSVYGQSLKDISEKVENLQFSINGLQEEYEWLDPEDPERDTVQSMIQSKIYQKQYQEQLKKQIDGIMNQLQSSQFTTVSEYLDKCYEEGYLGAMYDLHGQGIPLIMPIDQEQMVRAVQLDSKISQGLYTRLGEDVAVLKKKITAQVSRAISSGLTWKQAAQQLAGYTNIGYNNAVRITRTEGHRIQSAATMDAAVKAKQKGADVLKQWDAALDARTRDSHARVDGEIRELEEKFSNGLMFPGDPSGIAAEVVNCRCRLNQRARWALDEGELTILEERAAYFGLDKTDNFNDFKKKYIKAAENPLTNTGESDKISLDRFVPAASIEEAVDYLKTLGISVSYDYKSIDLGVANMINKEITEIYKTFGNLHEMGVLDQIFIQTGKTNYYAAYQRQMKTMILNKSRVSSKTALSKMKSDAKTQKYYGFWSTDEAEHSVRHELGHAIDYAYVRDKGYVNNPKADKIAGIMNQIADDCGVMRWSQAAPKEEMQSVGKKLSYYGLMTEKEFVAESVAEYMTGNPRETAKQVIDILLNG